MSLLQLVTAGIAIAGAVIFIIGLIIVLVTAQRRRYPSEIAPIKKSPAMGVLYAFTLGMAPWAKESARLHWVAYLRGIIIHAGIFIGAAFLIATPWLTLMPIWLRLFFACLFGVGALLGVAGFWLRLHDPTMHILSTPDDYFSLALVTLFLAAGSAVAAVPSLLPAFWVISGVTLAYTPFGKMKHSIYFAYERVILGQFFGRRGVLEWTHE